VPAVARRFTTRADLSKRLAETASAAGFARETRTAGRGGKPLRWRDTRADLDRRAQRWGRVLGASGVTQEDRVLVRLPLASAVGGDCVATLTELGALWTAADAALDFGPTVLITTPTDALQLSHCDELAGRVRLVFVSGEPGGSIPSTRRALEERLRARCVDVYALTEAGIVGWSCLAAPGGVHLDEDAFGVETDRGELIVTSLEPSGIPLERYRTGDLARLGDRRECSCGSAWVRAECGILGRVDELVVVGGAELWPAAIEDVVRRHPAVREFTIAALANHKLAVTVEPDGAIASEGDRARVAAEVSEDLRRSLGVRLPCEVVPPGTLGEQDAARRARRFTRQ
jgi:phenylacetate-CoA ligase